MHTGDLEGQLDDLAHQHRGGGHAALPGQHGVGDGVVGAVDRRGWTWFVLVGVIGLFVLLRMQERVEPVVALLAISLAGVVWGSVRGRLAQPSFLLQVAGLVVFGALALAGLVIAPDIGRYQVAVGWFAHGLWDIAHYRADEGVARTGAEWCAVVDVVIAVQLVLLPLVM